MAGDVVTARSAGADVTQADAEQQESGTRELLGAEDGVASVAAAPAQDSPEATTEPKPESEAKPDSEAEPETEAAAETRETEPGAGARPGDQPDATAADLADAAPEAGSGG